MSNFYFVSDLHLNHVKICEYSNRPFGSVDEMNRVIIDNWNQMVTPEDEIYLLGDVCMGQRHLMAPLVARLMGRIHLVKGNHDVGLLKNPDNHKFFASVSDLLEIEIPDPKAEKGAQLIVMCHYAVESWHDQHRNAWMLHGHCVDSETEILTCSGWKKHENIVLNEPLYTLNKETGALEKDEVMDILKYPQWSGIVHHLDGKSASIRVTDNHTMVSKRHETMEIFEEEAGKFFKRKKFNLILSGEQAESKIELSDDMIKLYILIAADGSIKTETNLVRIRVWKDRKKEYVNQVLNKLNLPFNRYDKPNGNSSFNFYLPKELNGWRVKGLDWKLTSCSKGQFEAVIDAYRNSDGSKNGAGTIIYSQKEGEIDILQAAAVVNGFSATKFTRNNGFGPNRQHQLSVYPRTDTSSKPLDRYSKQEVQKDFFWCIKTRNQNFICRRNGKVHITGNSHGSLRSPTTMRRLDVGVDATAWRLGRVPSSYRPLTYEEIREYMSHRSFEPVDNHGKEFNK